MKGTDKQIKWANDIKAKIMAAFDAMSGTDRKAEYKALTEWLDGKDAAAWWIEKWQLNGNREILFLRSAIKEWRS